MQIAYWCVLISILLPYLWFAIFSLLVGRRRDINDPREVAMNLEGRAKRAWGAQLNSFESSTGFVAGVVIATLAQAPQYWIDLLATVFVVLRIVHGILYLAGFGSARSAVWVLGVLCTVGLFIIGAI